MNEAASMHAIVIGSGPNGLACAIALRQKGLSVALYESSQTVGGAVRSSELTLPGFTHDIFSACYPMAAASPFLKTLPLEKFGLEWIYSPAEIAHPFEKQKTVLLYRSLEKTSLELGEDGRVYQNLLRPFVDQSPDLLEDIMGPLWRVPRNLGLLARFGAKAILSANQLAREQFKTPEAQALFMGIAAHSAIPLTQIATAAPGLILNIVGHTTGWPFPKGGAQGLSQALAKYFESLGGKIHLGQKITNANELPPARFVFFDLTPRQILQIARDKISPRVARGFENYKYGPGVFKMDWALDSPIPWRDPDTAKAMTVHIGGSLKEIRDGEAGLLGRNEDEKPFVLLCQPSLFDSTRAPLGKHTAWAYCHVPQGSTKDMSHVIENQIERFAPGFKKTIVKKSVLNSVSLEALNSNLVGGDISGGLLNVKQLLFRPLVKLNPYSLGNKKYFICSSSTPPGPGVHGMCGFHAAHSACKISLI